MKPFNTVLVVIFSLILCGCSSCYTCQHGADHYYYVQKGPWLNIYDENGIWQGAAKTK